MEVKDTVAEDTTRPEKLVPTKRKGSRKRSIIIFTIVSLLNVGLLALLWSQLITPAQNSAGTNSNGLEPLKGHIAPNFTLAALSPAQAKAVSLASFKGKSVVLNFWASSCAPCREEAPMLQRAWQDAQAKGIVFIGVDFQDVKSDGLGFMQKYSITYLNVFDPSGSTAIDYGVSFTPTTYFINSKGVVVHSIPREMTAQEVQTGLQLL